MRKEYAWGLACLAGAVAGCGLDSHGLASSNRDSNSAPAPDASPPDAATMDALGPPYPLVLAHGFFGFDDFADAGFFNYFYGVREALTARGYLVFTPTVDPFNDSTHRAEQLLEQIEGILAETGYAKVNLVGHSQGGLDVRAVASMRPDLVASVTTYAGPNTGLALTAVLDDVHPSDTALAALDSLVKVIAKPAWAKVDDDTSLRKALAQLAPSGIAKFNAQYPDQPGVAYFSIGGRTALRGNGDDCAADDRPDFITKWDDTRDLVDPFLANVAVISAGGLTLHPAVTDGFVRASEARWGRFLGCVPADHLDEVGQLAGDSPGLGNSFDHIELFADLAAWLQTQGY